MKKVISTFVFVVLMMIPFTTLRSQDLIKVAPEQCKLLNDTLNVRLIQVTLKPGEELPLHTHPVFQFYVLSGGTIRHIESDGKYFDFPVTPGMHLQGKATTKHGDKNVGDTTIQFLLTEIGN
jgi:beta-alanine degradation protein BauB